MKNRKPQVLVSALALAALAALGSGCGQQAYNEQSNNGAGTTGTGTTSSPPNYTNNPSPNPTPTTVSSSSNGSPSYSYHFYVTGTGDAAPTAGSMTVTADTILKVQITAGSNGYISGYPNYPIGYNCEWFDVAVGNVSQQAFVKKANYSDYMLAYGWMSYDPCAAASTTWTGDFSAATGAGSRTFSVIVNNTQTDNCASTNGDTRSGGCAQHFLKGNYVVDGMLQVFTH